jgi:hypothetical protein
MKPVFSPDAQLKVDVSRLRVVFDTDFKANFLPADPKAADPKETYLKFIETALHGWELAICVAMVDIDLQHKEKPGDYVVQVGMGENAIDPGKTLHISYVNPAGGYFFQDDVNATIFAHEFGHLMGLADRYYNGYAYDPSLNEAGDRVTVAMAPDMFKLPDGSSSDPTYVPTGNIMSTPRGASWTVSMGQTATILARQEEPQNPMDVIGVFDKNDESGVWSVPATMLRVGDFLFAAVATQPLRAGYTYSAVKRNIRTQAKREMPNGDKDVRVLWNKQVEKRDKKTGKLVYARTKGHGGRNLVDHREHAYLHRAQMTLIARLAGS